MEERVCRKPVNEMIRRILLPKKSAISQIAPHATVEDGEILNVIDEIHCFIPFNLHSIY